MKAVSTAHEDDIVVKHIPTQTSI